MSKNLTPEEYLSDYEPFPILNVCRFDRIDFSSLSTIDRLDLNPIEQVYRHSYNESMD